MTALAFDTETTGLDWHHGARPFFIAACDTSGDQVHWEWEVNPLTRAPVVPVGDLYEVWEFLEGADELVGHNVKFDATACRAAGIWGEDGRDWPWHKTHDTLLAAHLLASNQPKDLTSLAALYLGTDIQPYEDRLEEIAAKCRRIVQQARLRVKRGKAVSTNVTLFDDPEADLTVEPLAVWAIAEKGRPDMPSAKEKCWKMDTWLPRAMYHHLADTIEFGEPELQQYGNWLTVLRDYANTDSAVTAALWPVLRAELERRKLWALYEERRRLLPIAHEMEWRGLTLSGSRLTEMMSEYTEKAESAATVCTKIAAGYGHVLELPKGGRNKSLDTFCFDVLQLPPVYNKKSKTDKPSLDSKVAISHYLATLPPTGRPRTFIQSLANKRAYDTAVSYLEGYRRFWLPSRAASPKGKLLAQLQSQLRATPDDEALWNAVADLQEELRGETEWEWYALHPNLNLTGTDTLRWSSSSPNEQNISKKEDEYINVNLRRCFGPLPGREWWSLDAKNIELRIPFYVSGEESLIELFEHPDDPPYYGSVHLANCHAVYAEEWAELEREVGYDKVGPEFKKRYKATHYQNGKNGGFAKQYGGQRGIVDATFRRRGAYDLLDSKFSKLATLNAQQLAFARETGYVETLPDKAVDPERGYPLLVTRTLHGDVLPTVPLSFFVQGTAMWWTARAMVKCEEQLAKWRRDGFDCWMVMQVHDELVFDFPKRGDPLAEYEKAKKSGRKSALIRTSNLWRVCRLQEIMASCGDDIGIPTPVGCAYHRKNWGEEATL